MARHAIPGDFDKLVLPHLRSAYGLARVFLKKREDAEDAVQEAALKALEHWGAFEGRGGGAKPWLLSIVRNVCLSRLRKPENATNVVHLDTVLGEVERGQVTPALGRQPRGPDEQVIAKADADRVHRALARLPVLFREALILRELDELTYQEIATMTGVPLGTVMSRLARGRERLKAVLLDDGEGDFRNEL